jgi:uncharacterized protein
MGCGAIAGGHSGARFTGGGHHRHARCRAEAAQQALDLQKRKGSQLQVLVVASTQPETIEEYTQRAYDQWKLGRKGVDDGLLLVVAKDDRRVRIQPGYGLEGAIPDAIANRVIQEYLVPHFRQGDYAGGITDATAVLVKLIDGETLPAPVSDNDGGGRDRSPDWVFALFAAFIAASVVGPVRPRAQGLAQPVHRRRGRRGGVAFLGLAAGGGIAALLGLVYGLLGVSLGSFANRGGWGLGRWRRLRWRWFRRWRQLGRRWRHVRRRRCLGQLVTTGEP